MDTRSKRKVLEHLASSTSNEARQALRAETLRLTGLLASESSYEVLTEVFADLKVLVSRFPSEIAGATTSFLQHLEHRHITTSHPSFFKENGVKYDYGNSLSSLAIDLLSFMGLLMPRRVFRTLFSLADHKHERVRKKALEGLKSLGTVDLFVYSGRERGQGHGVTAQLAILDEVESLEFEELQRKIAATLAVMAPMLSSELQGYTWRAESMTISRARLPSHSSVGEMRARTIAILEKIIETSLVPAVRLSALSTLNAACRPTEAPDQSTITAFFERDAIRVLTFYAKLAMDSDLLLVEKVEHNAYWVYRHALTDTIANAALTVRSALAGNSEFQIFKVLVGYEGIFGDWERLKAGSEKEFDVKEGARTKRLFQLVESVSQQTATQWHQRILRYSKVESNDLATFQFLHRFLEQIASLQPDVVAMFLEESVEELRHFLISMFRGLLKSGRRQWALEKEKTWVKEGRYLTQITKQFLDNEDIEATLLKLILEKAIVLGDRAALRMLCTVAVSNVKRAPGLLQSIFIPSVGEMTKLSSADWVYEMWFRDEFEVSIGLLSDADIDLLLRNLTSLLEINYQAEEVLFWIAKRSARKVIDHLAQRVIEQGLNALPTKDQKFEALPHELHKLHEPLSLYPQYVLMVGRGLWMLKRPELHYDSARLVRIIFPSLPEELVTEMVGLAELSPAENAEYLASVLGEYRGMQTVFGVARQIVRFVEPNSTALARISDALSSTGLVMGEMGIAESYEGKAQLVREWQTDESPRVREFASELLSFFERAAMDERKEAVERALLRKHQYSD